MIYPILWLVIIGLAHSDPVNVHVEINCQHAGGTMGKWCGLLTRFEEDEGRGRYSTPYFAIMSMNEFCVNGDGRKTIDYEVYPDAEYSLRKEFKFTFTHNCTSDGQKRCIILGGTQNSLLEERSVTFNINAHDSGETGQCYDPTDELYQVYKDSN